MGEREDINRLTGDVGSLRTSVEFLKEGQAGLKLDLATKHVENRNSIHDLRDDNQTFYDRVEERVEDIAKRLGKVEVKVAIGAAFGTLAASVGMHYLDKVWK